MTKITLGKLHNLWIKPQETSAFFACMLSAYIYPCMLKARMFAFVRSMLFYYFPFNSRSFVLSPPTAALRVMLELLVAVCFSTAHIFNANDTLSPSIDWLTEATKREHVKIRYAWKCTAPGDNFKCMLLIYIRCRFFWR